MGEQDPSVAALLKEWADETKEIEQLETVHKDYVTKLNELHNLQADCLKKVKAHNKNVSKIKDELRKLQQNSLSADDSSALLDLGVETADKRTKLLDLQESLPREYNGLYLNVILGDVDVSLLNKRDKFRYKDGYETFKLYCTLVTMVVTLLSLVVGRRFFDAVLHFLLVWYYCTLTIRESVLRINGSRIKGWWVTHHYIAAVLCGVLITWPDRDSYLEFRRPFLYFTGYLSMVQMGQYFYQQGCLYRLRSLGLRQEMDVTVEGFQSWMFKGLSFLLPFLFIGYMWQLYMAYKLYTLWNKHSDAEWQVLALFALFMILAIGNVITTLTSTVLALFALFMILAIGNVITTLTVVWKKFQTDTFHKPHKRRRLETKYSMDLTDADEKKDS